ncbi:MAG TPA: glycosyl hydrolase, partial [Saprospiraceae bacterium]|nr:glycosyl hydrolase [Saprospiraceae bacterium]
AQVLIKTSDMGKTWKEVSPDLTRNQKEKQGKGGGPFTNEIVGAENYGTLAYVIESPHEKGVLWTGSDDGLVHITRDNGTSWTNVTPADLKECLVNAIEVSPHDKATAYIATTRYKFNDHTPAIYKTTDYGKTWENISNGLPYGAFTRVVREDDQRKDLLFVGTEIGIYISWNSGKTWAPFQLNLPNTPITDLKIHRNNLIAATSGRSIWILDDLHFLRQVDKVDMDQIKFYEPAMVTLVNSRSEMDGNTDKFTGSHPSRGINPARGAVLYFQLPKDYKGDVNLEITNSNNKLVRKYTSVRDKTFISYDG